MQTTILTLFPEMFSGPFSCSIVKRAVDTKILEINFVNIRDFGIGKHKQVDDRPYGGGVGMVMRADVIDKALKSIKAKKTPRMVAGKRENARHDSSEVEESRKIKQKTILLDPKGKTYNQAMARRLSKYDHLILVCGHYEGVDHRVTKLVDESISIGNYVLTGGEIPAMVVVDSITRLLPGVLLKKEATFNESFQLPTLNFPRPMLEYPQYTRPEIYKKMKVPKILLSGNHKKIENWRILHTRRVC